MSKREHLLEFRADFQGPVRFKMGDTLWTRVESRVQDRREYFLVQVKPTHSGFADASEAYSQIYDGQEWDGRFVIPCSFVRFSEQEEELRTAREGKT